MPEDLEQLESASFIDAEEGKTQEGWLLRDVLLLYIKESKLKADTQVTVSSSSREKAKTLTWAEVVNLPENMVMFDLSGRGTLKLVSTIPGFDIRDSWIQDVDRIEVIPAMKQRYFSTFQLILLALFSALVVVAKIALRTPIQLSGHSGIFWMAIIVVGVRVVPKPGASFNDR